MSLKGILYSLVILLGIFACSTPQKLTGETSYAGESEKGTILLDAYGYGSTKSAALDNAHVNAFKNLLFKGIPGSFQYNALVGKNPLTVEKNNKAFFDDFFESKTYEQFIVNKQENGRLNAGKLKTQLKINVNTLRSFLEQNKVIRKFGL